MLAWAPLYWWKEFDTYKVGTVANSCSTMHKIAEKEFTLEDFSTYNQTRNVMLNYEVLANIYRQRKNHKLDEWREVCKWIESLPYNELITVDSREAIKEELRKEIWKHMALLNTLKYIQIS